MARRILLALACIGAAEAGSALAEGTTPLTAANFDDFVEGALAAGKTAMAPGWRAAVEHYKDDAGVVFGDVNLREGRVTQSRDGTPQNPGAGGWPTLRYYNADTGPGGAPVERITTQKICDEFKIPQRMIDAVTTSRKVCDAVTKKGCDEEEALYLDTWRGDAAARDAEAARLDDLLSDATQKKMKAQRKLLAKLAKVSAKDEL